MLKLTHHTETLPVTHPTTPAQIEAAHAELHECLQALKAWGPLYDSPRMHRRYTEAQAAVNNITKEVAA